MGIFTHFFKLLFWKFLKLQEALKLQSGKRKKKKKKKRLSHRYYQFHCKKKDKDEKRTC